MGKRFDWLLLAGAAGFALLCHFVLLVPHPHIEYSGDAKNQVEIKKPFPLLDSAGSLATVGWARHPYPSYNPENIRRISMLPYLSNLHRYRVKEWDNYHVWNEEFSFSVSISDYGYIAKVAVNFVDFKTQKYSSNGFTVPTAELHMPTNINKEGTHVQLASSKFGVSVHVSVAKDFSRTVKVSTAEFAGEFTLRPSTDQEYLTLVTPIGGSNFYYNVKLYNSVPEGSVTVDGDEHSITRDTFSFFEWSRGVYDYRSDWVQLSATMVLEDKRKLSLNFGKGLGDQSSASENAVILDDKIYKLGLFHIAYDENSLMNPWIILSPEGQRIVFAPFVDYQTESSKTFLFLGTRTQRIFGKFLGSFVLETGEEINLHDVTGFAEVHYHTW